MPRVDDDTQAGEGVARYDSARCLCHSRTMLIFRFDVEFATMLSDMLLPPLMRRCLPLFLRLQHMPAGYALR